MKVKAKVKVICVVGTYDREIENYKERLIFELSDEEDIEIFNVSQDNLGKTPNLIAVGYETTEEKNDTTNYKKHAELNDKIRAATDKLYAEDCNKI